MVPCHFVRSEVAVAASLHSRVLLVSCRVVTFAVVRVSRARALMVILVAALSADMVVTLRIILNR